MTTDRKDQSRVEDSQYDPALATAPTNEGIRAEHTPGPWRMDRMATYIWAKDRLGEFMVAQIRGWGHLTGVGGLNLPEDKAVAIQEANGRLLAAAPELLEAAKWAVMEWRLHGQLTDSCRHVEAAIAKAEGR
jgi:hypothetical protein